MEEYVQLKLETYDDLKERISDLEHSILEMRSDERNMLLDMKDQTNAINVLHEYIMEQNVNTIHFKECSLEELTNFNSVYFAMCYKTILLRLGITEDEMIECIKEKYNEWKKEVEE